MSHNYPSQNDQPTSTGCCEDNTNPCDFEQVAGEGCRNQYTDDRLVDLPATNRMGLIGSIGKGMYRFFSGKNGFVVSDKMGQHITNRPCVPIPYLKSYALDPNTNEPLLDVNGDPLEATPPPVDSLLVTDDCGCQNRLQGVKNRKQNLVWDANGFKLEDASSSEKGATPSIPLEDLIIEDFNSCGGSIVAGLKYVTEQVAGSCGTKTVSSYKLVGMNGFGIPEGVMQLWAGDENDTPDGWLLADGSELVISDYPRLYQAIGSKWGQTPTTFFLPDTRGRVARGVDLGAGNDPDALLRTALNVGGVTGDSVGTYQEDSMQCFKVDYDRKRTVLRNVRQSTSGPIAGVQAFTNSVTNFDANIGEDGCGELRTSDENRMKNFNAAYIIKADCN